MEKTDLLQLINETYHIAQEQSTCCRVRTCCMLVLLPSSVCEAPEQFFYVTREADKFYCVKLGIGCNGISKLVAGESLCREKFPLQIVVRPPDTSPVAVFVRYTLVSGNAVIQGVQEYEKKNIPLELCRENIICFSCDDGEKSPSSSKEHHEWSIRREFHAEDMAIIQMATRRCLDHPLCDTLAAILLVAPCLRCAERLILAGVRCVIFCVLYDRDKDQVGISLLLEKNVKVYALFSKGIDCD